MAEKGSFFCHIKVICGPKGRHSWFNRLPRLMVKYIRIRRMSFLNSMVYFLHS